MARQQIISGIDIGTSKVTTIITSLNDEGGDETLNVIGVATVPSRGLRKSQVVDIEETVEVITSSVEAAERMAGYSISSAFVSIGGIHIESQNSKGVVAVAQPEGEINSEDVHRVIEAARAVSLPSSREIIHVIPRDFIVDSQSGIKDPVGMTGVRLEAEAHLITGSQTAMRNLVKCVNEVGVDVDNLVFSGLAGAQAVLSDTERELGVVLVDIGGGTTSLAVFIEGSLAYSSVLPIGARNITNDIAIGLRISLESSEKIKIALSSAAEIKKKTPADSDELDISKLGLEEELNSVSRKTLVEGIIQPRLNEIFTMVGMRLKESGFGGATPAGVVLSGGGAETVGVVQACKRVLALPVRIGRPMGLAGLIDEIQGTSFGVGVGLVQYGKQNFSLTSRKPLKSFSRLVNKIPIKGAAGKVIDFVKSFLP
ncbi:cell division protein FtsA [Patescibacteria group bacterium]|nr:cell division protein FtsA [Patescibacteria group bacterium]MBU1931747.1 cell division protein FtsA [Patescibacteria group bacterium]